LEYKINITLNGIKKQITAQAQDYNGRTIYQLTINDEQLRIYQEGGNWLSEKPLDVNLLQKIGAAIERQQNKVQ